MEANAIYFGATPVVALYHGFALKWSGFEMPVQNGTKLSITQAYRVNQAGTALQLDNHYITGYEKPILTGNSLAITEVLGAGQINTQVVIQ